ncbi:MAG: hypothetical protein WBP64_07075 [Nitrososphaeraceae archaeon]
MVTHNFKYYPRYAERDYPRRSFQLSRTVRKLDLIKIGIKGSGVEFRIINITQKGLRNSSWSETHDTR